LPRPSRRRETAVGGFGDREFAVTDKRMRTEIYEKIRSVVSERLKNTRLLSDRYGADLADVSSTKRLM
jgi:hypothetical protein